MRKWYWLGGAKLLATITALVLFASASGQAQVYKYLPTLVQKLRKCTHRLNRR